MATPAILVPPVRLGRLLREARLERGESLGDLVQRADRAVDESWFAAVEDGRFALDEKNVRELGELYGLPASELVPTRSRLVIDLNEGSIAAGDHRVPLDEQDPDHILTNYLALVYLLRGVEAGTPIPLRAVDLAVLSEALRRPEHRIEAKLTGLMRPETLDLGARTSLLRRRVVVPVAGVFVGLTAVGGLLLVPGDSSGAGASPGAAVARGAVTGAVEIGDAVYMERESPDDPIPEQQVRR